MINLFYLVILDNMDYIDNINNMDNMDNDNYEIKQGNSLINIKKQKEKKVFNNQIKENFDTLTNDSKFLDPGQVVLKKKDGIGGPVVKKNMEDFEELKEMKIQYFRDLNTYNGIYDNLMKDTKLYLETVSNENSNSFKDGRFSNGSYGYITDRGVYKWYPNPNTVNNTGGKNNCPGKWTGRSNNLGDGITSANTGDFIEIPNNKPLRKGSQMIAGQSCGNEGQNIYVTESSVTTPAKYMGCYNPSDMSQQTDMGNNRSVDECALRAQDRGTNFFGMSNINGNNKGVCYIGGSDASNKINGKAYSINETWKHDYNNYDDPNYHQTYAILTNRGVLQFVNRGKVVWKSGSGGSVGNYRLVLQNDGNLVVYNNSNNVVWASGTNGKTGDAGTGPSGASTMYAGQRFSSMSSSTKNCYFSINSEKKRKYWFLEYRIYRFRIKYRKWNCKKLSTPSGAKTQNQWIGNQNNSRALYKTNNANRSGVTTVSHISDDSKLSLYPENLKYYPNSEHSVKNIESQFQKISGYDSYGNDILSYTGTVEEAKKKCASRNDCAGFAYKNGMYWLKNSNMYPKGTRYSEESTDLYIRKPEIKNHSTCGKQVNFANNDLYLNYPRKGRDMSLNTLCGLGVISESYKQRIQESYAVLLQTLEKIRLKVIELTGENVVLNKELMKEYKKMMSDLKKYEEIYNDIRVEKKLDTQVSAMHEDSDIQMISENYNYMLWGILAIIILFGTIKTLKKH